MSPAEREVRDFVAEFPTPATRQMLAACEAGLITWADAHVLAREALAAGIAEVSG